LQNFGHFLENLEKETFWKLLEIFGHFLEIFNLFWIYFGFFERLKNFGKI
jgi:hypothetical protein